jgi:hypothetical protein
MIKGFRDYSIKDKKLLRIRRIVHPLIKKIGKEKNAEP